MPEFYHDLITERSFKLLQELKRKFNFILIGGWAIFLYVHALKSKDIDLIVDYDELEKLKREYNVSKNERLKKYEAKIETVAVDIYLPYFSILGMPVEDIKIYCREREGFSVPRPEILIILKIYAFKERAGTTKGKKDLLDIMSLIKEETIDWGMYKELIKTYRLETLNQALKNLISTQTSIPELSLRNNQIARLRKKVLKNI